MVYHGGVPRSRAKDDQLDDVFHALADRTRRALLTRLVDGSASVTELAEPFAISLPAVSKHLKVLEQAGLIARTVEGRVHRCSLDPRGLREAGEWVDHYRQFWDDTLAALADYVEAAQPGDAEP
jgi:DNA-binding transcriptional ArsR family regulator